MGKQIESRRGDTFKWLLVWVLLTAGVAANMYYGQVVAAVRLSVGIVWIIGLLFIAAQTAKGQKVQVFIKGSRAEMRKVVWPDRPQIIQMSLIVVVMVIITSLLLWGIDSVLMYGVSLLMGHGG